MKFVALYENINTGYVGVIGYADSGIECVKLIHSYRYYGNLAYNFYPVRNLPFIYVHTEVHKPRMLCSIYDDLLLNQCTNVASALSFFDLAVKRGRWKKAKYCMQRVLSYCRDTDILDNY